MTETEGHQIIPVSRFGSEAEGSEYNHYIEKVSKLRASLGFPDRHRGRTTVGGGGYYKGSVIGTDAPNISSFLSPAPIIVAHSIDIVKGSELITEIS